MRGKKLPQSIVNCILKTEIENLLAADILVTGLQLKARTP